MFQLRPIKFVRIHMCNPGFLFWTFVWRQRSNVVQLKRGEQINLKITCWHVVVQVFGVESVE